MSFLVSQINLADKTYVHVGSSNDELASQLEGFGLNKSGLPTSLGGSWESIIWLATRANAVLKVSIRLDGFCF
jgi:hypothetical protein